MIQERNIINGTTTVDNRTEFMLCEIIKQQPKRGRFTAAP